MKKSLTLLLAALLFAASVAGCAPELYERALISAVGVDKTEDGCRVTVRAAQANAGGTEISLSGEGKTVPEALNEITRVTGQQPLYSHNTLVVFGMDCAQAGLKEYLDFFLRQYDSECYFAVSRPLNGWRSFPSEFRQLESLLGRQFYQPDRHVMLN